MRHRGTFGGALAHADPAGDLPAVALALDAEFVVAGPGGRRTVPAADFFVDYLTTALGEGEILVEVRVPKLGDGWGMHYEKFQRVAQAWSIVAVAAAVRRENGHIAEARIGLTNMGPTPLRASRRRGGAGRGRGLRRRDRRGRRPRGGGHQPEQRPQRGGRLPAAPGPGADQARGQQGRRPVGAPAGSLLAGGAGRPASGSDRGRRARCPARAAAVR